MQPTQDDINAIHSLAEELRNLPERGDSIGERLEDAGRFLLEAIKCGAFSAGKYRAWLARIDHRASQINVSGPVSAWSEAVTLFHKGGHSIADDFVNDCTRMADLFQTEAKRLEEPDVKPAASHTPSSHLPADVVWSPWIWPKAAAEACGCDKRTLLNDSSIQRRQTRTGGKYQFDIEAIARVYGDGAAAEINREQ